MRPADQSRQPWHTCYRPPVQVQIPDEDRRLIQGWLDDSSMLESILTGLESARPALSAMALAEDVAQRTAVDFVATKRIIRTLLHMSGTYRNFSPGERSNAAEIFFQSLSADPNQRERFENLFERIVKISALELTGKALSVLTDNQNVFRSARTLSEIRPVFREDGLEADALLILHQLKLEYTEGPPHQLKSSKELFIAMDHDDLLLLKEVVERALLKHERIAALVSKLDVTHLGSN